MTEIELILFRHLKAIGKDVDSFLENIADNAVFIGSNGTFCGKEKIRGMIEELFDYAPPELFDDVRVIRQEMIGGITYVTYTIGSLTVNGLNTIIIRNGKIVAQTLFWPDDEQE